jgi:hypothetical protein
MSLLKNIISNSYKIYDEIQNYDLDMLKKSNKIRMTKISISKKYKSLIHHGIILGIYCEEAQTIQIEIGYNLIYEVKLQPYKVNFIYDDYVFPIFLPFLSQYILTMNLYNIFLFSNDLPI